MRSILCLLLWAASTKFGLRCIRHFYVSASLDESTITSSTTTLRGESHDDTSTLEYLDDQRSVKSFGLVPWAHLHDWLSALNGMPSDLQARLPKGLNRGKVLEELEARRLGTESGMVDGALKIFNLGIGYGKDWREYENPDGYTHLEELSIHQPRHWRKQVREYLFRYDCNLDRESTSEDTRTFATNVNGKNITLFVKTPILAVLLHPEMERTSRYEPLNFLLAYGARTPLPSLLKDFESSEQMALIADLSPMDYFLEFQNYVSSYRLDKLREIGEEASFSRLCLIKELDFCDIVGQRLAKQMIRQSVVSHMWNRAGNKKGIRVDRQPLSLTFAGPSGNGKTELAHWLARLLNKPSDDFYIKIDCGKLSNAGEIFGMSGAYRGAEQGSALNNFVLRMSLELQAVGIVLLDEIEKASQDVIHALYQVIDKGEWTNKRLTSCGSQTKVISCQNLIFIMTTNACDSEILDFVKQHEEIYDTVADDLEDLGSELSTKIRGILQFSYPFTEAFLGRVGRVVPFLPMAKGDPNTLGVIHGESMAVAKILIERQQEKLSRSSTADVQQLVSSTTKHQIAKIVVKEAIQEAGVRAIQTAVEKKMGDRIMNALLLERGGIEGGSRVRYFAKEDAQAVDFRVEDLDNDVLRGQNNENPDNAFEDDLDLYE